MILNVTLTGDAETVDKLGRLPTSVLASLYKKCQELALRLEAWIKTQKLDGQVLNRKTGRLARSIGSKVEQDPHRVIATVFQSADVPYGRIHEFGGKTPAHIILPKKAAVLAFAGKDGKAFATRVRHPGSTMPERSYMRSGLRDLSEDISRGLKEAVVMGLSGT